jgi:hypothetical protein
MGGLGLYIIGPRWYFRPALPHISHFWCGSYPSLRVGPPILSHAHVFPRSYFSLVHLRRCIATLMLRHRLGAARYISSWLATAVALFGLLRRGTAF